ncbi:phage baseplate protein [Veillonella intestinalis]|uniref:phage baseplate protein n=1 Tax=Veillonella intestinalis TaxID=2941341 RepID=UPI00203BA851|nr:hypothetical protein [Veillonella intestinalis]
MAYQEIYPLNDSPSGDTRREAILKNRQEMLNIADEIDKKSNGNGSGGGLRNRVLSGSVSGGQYNYLSGDSLSVSIDGTMAPVIVTFANGFDVNGTVDYIKSITSRVTPWSLPTNTTSYLYLDYDIGTGAINYDSTTIKPVISNSPPDAADDGSNYYNELLAKSFTYNGLQWVDKVRVFIAAVTTNDTDVIKIEYLDRSDSTITSNQIGNGTVQTVNLADNSVTTSKLKDKSVTANKLGDDVNKVINNVLNKVYPVGSIYCSTVSTNPHTLFGFGNWQYIEQGRVLLSQGSNYKAGSTGGEATHKLTINEMPSHNHGTNNAGTHSHTGNTNSAGAHSHNITDFLLRGRDDNAGYGNDNYRGNKATDSAGAHSHTLTTNSTGGHTHSITSTGGNAAHNNMQPYLAVYMWQRVS